MSSMGNTKDLDSSRTEALQGLLSSLGHTSDDLSSRATFSTEHVRKLSEKINEILGDGPDRDLTLGDKPVQLMNKDGLPIIDISEPVNEDSQTIVSAPQFLGQGLIPFSHLPPDERERRRSERDRILDLLEEEERLQQLQEEQDAEEEWKEVIRKRKESAKVELEQLQAAQELQRKMGQALVGRAKGTKEIKQDNAHSKPQVTPLAAKKCVSFADTPVVNVDERNQQTLMHQPLRGDVTLGRLRAQDHIPLVSVVEAQRYPMKMHVVERHSAEAPLPPIDNDGDSDDESSSSAGHLAPHAESDISDEEEGSSSKEKGLLSDELLEEEFDLDIAQHHREVALEYHRKRHNVGAETAKAMAAHFFDDYEPEKTPRRYGQLPLSHFRTDRMATAYGNLQNPVSTSIKQSVIPTSRQKSLRESVRLGRLENDQLVGGGSGESGSDDETTREVIQMLKTGNIWNAGPDSKAPSTPAMLPLPSPDTVESLSTRTSTAANGVKPSRFKLTRGGITETSSSWVNNSGGNLRSQTAVSSVVERKVPGSSSSRCFPGDKPPLPPPADSFEPAPPMIMDSPSFIVTNTSTVSSPPPSETQLERPPAIKSRSTQDPITRSRVP